MRRDAPAGVGGLQRVPAPRLDLQRAPPSHFAMPVPLLELTTQNGVLADELKAACAAVIDSGRYIMGPELEAFETEVAAWIGVDHALGVSSGTDALLLALMGLGIGPGDEVIVPSFTFFATAGCVSRTGATPVFADCCPRCFNVRREDVEPLITERTKAIMPVHLFGQCAPMEGLLALAQERGLALIEDAAQAIGARFQDRPAGSMGAIGCFSFFPSKTLGGFGDSGLVTTNDGALAEKMRRLRVHGGHPKYYHAMIGGNFRMDPLQAALLRLKLPNLDGYIAGRRRNAALYEEQLAEVAGDALILPIEAQDQFHTYNQFTLRLPGAGRRDALRQHLGAAGIGCEVYYPVPLHQQTCFADVAAAGNPLPRCEQLSQEVISVPIFPELQPSQIEEVATALKAFLAGEKSS